LLFLFRDFCVPKKSRTPLAEILCPPLILGVLTKTMTGKITFPDILF